jgi:uroporphyrinogen-III decarboxylase
LIGNVDLRLLATGTPEQVESCVLDLAQLCALDGRYILSSGNSIPKFLKPENVMAMGRAIQTFNKENFE